MSNVEDRDAMKTFQSPVRGKEIMELCGLNEGKVVGRIKHAIEEAILNGEIDNEYDAAKEFMLNNKDEFLTEIDG